MKLLTGVKNTWNFHKDEVGTFLVIRQDHLDREEGTAVSPARGKFRTGVRACDAALKLDHFSGSSPDSPSYLPCHSTLAIRP